MNTPRYPSPGSPGLFSQPQYDVQTIIRELRRLQTRVAVLEDELNLIRVRELIREQQDQSDSKVTPVRGYGDFDR